MASATGALGGAITELKNGWKLSEDDSALDKFLVEHEASSDAWRTLVTFRDVYGRPPFEGQLSDVLQNLDLRKCLEISTWLSIRLRRTLREEASEVSARVLAGFFSAEAHARINEHLAANPRAMLASQEVFGQLATARLLVRESSGSPAIDPTIAFGTALLLVNEILVHSAPDAIITKLAGALRNILRDAGNERTMAYRYLRFREWAKSPLAKMSENYIDVESIFAAHNRIDLDDYYAAGLFLAGAPEHMDVENDANAIMPIFTLNWDKMSNVTPLRRFLSTHSISREYLTKYFEQELLENAVRRWHQPLLQAPIVALNRREYFIPSRELLRYSILTGPYFQVFSAVRHCENQRRKASQFFGAFFEAYARELLNLAVLTSGLRLFAPRKYSKHNIETTDSVVWDGERLFFFECVATWTTDDLIANLGIEELSSLLKRVAFDKIKELQNRLRDFRAGKYRFADVSPDVTIVPVIIHPQTLPRGPLFSFFVNKHLKTIGASADFDNLEFMEIEALESTVEWLGGNRTRLWEFFSAKRASTTFRSSSCMEFLLESKLTPLADVPGTEDKLREWRAATRDRFASWLT